MVGSYERTDDIKQKQRQKMLEKTKEYDWDSIVEKRKVTIEENNIKVGRKKGEGAKKTGWFKCCKMCNNEFWVTPSTEKKRIYCSRTCMASDKEYRDKLRTIDRHYQKTEEWASWLRKEDLTEYKKYRGKVIRLSEKTYVESMSIINPNNHPRTIAGVDGGYQLDHKTSIKKCFELKISVEEASSVDNLQMLPWLDNIKKG